jgi:decaprenyl-phosphate phosphoribosyltransferase
VSRFRDYVGLARPDHWFKNVFMLPGVLLSWLASPNRDLRAAVISVCLGLASACLICSSNYTINEWLDAPEDRKHPEKKNRPAAAGRINAVLAYIQWIVLGAAGLGLAWVVNRPFFFSALALLVMGIVYNVRPIRSKDRAYLDVLSESVNNPLRLLLGWYAVGSLLIPPASLLLSYWMLGAFFMAIKRFAEMRHINDMAVASAYRRSFRAYTPERLLVSVIFYASAFGLFSGIFLIRYRPELVLAIPFLAGLMAVYMHLGFLPNSPAQHPEALFKHPAFLVYGITTAAVLVICMVIRIPWLSQLFDSTVPGGFQGLR